MPDQETQPTVGRLAYERSIHAPAFKRYDGSGFVEIGAEPKPGKPWRIHPETGAEIHALGRPGGKFSGDLRVGSYYPETTFIFADDAEGAALSHEDLGTFLENHDLWSDKLHSIVVPNGTDGEEWAWRSGFMFRPPESQPYSLDVVKKQLHKRFDLDDHEVLGNQHGFQAFIG